MSDISQVPVLAVWRALGGPEPRRGRAPAWWRRSRDPNVSINAARNVFYDHVQNRGGGVVALVETVLNFSRAEALAWLERQGFIESRTLTHEQRREHAWRRGKANSLALDIARWRDALTVELNARKLAAVRAGDDEALAHSASLCNSLENGSPERIVREFIRHRASHPAEVARLIAGGETWEREIRRIAAEVVLMLARAAELESLGTCSMTR